MKEAIILHGTSETDQSFWLPYAKAELEKKGFTVSIPALPDADNPDLKNWLPVALAETYSERTVLIGHSAGCPLILSVLENIDVKIKQAILVSGYGRPIGDYPKPEPILQDKYDWEKIKSHAEDIIFINSDNDPWGCDDKEGRYMWEHLGGTLILREGEGHMGSDKFDQPYREFPFLIKLTD